MCCFTGSAEVHVQGTTIFARLVEPGTQALAYQMSYAAKAPTAMVLPLPVALPAREGSVRFKNLKEYPDFFKALAEGFPAMASRSLSKGVPASVSATLAVHDVGEFVASFVPTVADFGRVDPRFALAPDVWKKLPAYQDYGFAVFQLKELSGAPHPIAFEFDSRLGEQVFFPTVHIHDGSVHEKDTFDHVLYTQAAAFDTRVDDYAGPESVDPHTGFVRSQARARDFADVGRSQGLLAADLLVHKVILRGELPNRDTFFGVTAAAIRKASAAGAPNQSGGCSRCEASTTGTGASLPVSLTMAGLGWSLLRRQRSRR